MKPRKARKIGTISMMVTVAVWMITLLGNWKTEFLIVLAIIGVGSFLIGLTLFLRYWRCPYCDSKLPTRWNALDVTCCPYCGNEIDKELG